MVRRLVQQQRVRTAEQCLRQQHAHLLPALQFAHLQLVQRLRNIQTVQQYRRVALRRVPVVLRHDAFQFAEAHPVFIRHVRLRVKPVALRQRVPQRPVTHDHRVDDAKIVECKLILAQHPQALWTHHAAFLRLQFASQDLHERRLARAVRTGQAIAPPRQKSHRDVFKQYFGAVAHAEIGN